jgi:signal transduction histidine kinase
MKTVADQVAVGLDRQKLINSLEKAKADLEWRVEERTYELEQAWQSLRQISARLNSLEEMQRKKIAQEIHDSLGSTLSGIKYKLEDIIQRIEDPEDKISVEVEKLIPWVKEAISESRRIQNDLSPAILYDLGLLATLSWFVRRFESVFTTIPVSTKLDVQEDEIPEPLKIVIYRIIQESFNNITKYSGTDRILLRLSKEEGELLLEVNDYGQGFELKNIKNSSDDRPGGLGISGMRERVEWTGGRFVIRSEINKGTSIEARWPLTEDSSSKQNGSSLYISLQFEKGKGDKFI